MFITLEGIDGSGKSTLSKQLAQWYRQQGHAVLETRDPGGTDLGKEIRQILLHHPGHVDPTCELLLYVADRAQHVAERIRPALAEGTIVLCDRYVDSTVAYQGYGRGLDLATIDLLNMVATQGMLPNKTLLLDGPVEALLNRARRQTAQTTQTPDRLEAEDVAFYERVRQGFLTLAQQHPQRFIVLDATLSPEAVLAQVMVQM